MPIALLFLFLITGGTSFVAKDSLPGEVLYPVKININENIESFLATNDKAEAIVSVKQAARRLEEADSLFSKGKLTSEKSTEIGDLFEKEVISMNKHLDKLSGKGDTQFVSELNDKLEVEIDDHINSFYIVSTNASNTPVIFEIFRRIEDKHNNKNEKDSKSSISNSQNKMEDGIEDDEDEDSDDDEDENEDDDNDDDRKTVILPAPLPVPTPAPTPVSNNATSGSTVQTFSMAQVSLHNKSTDCYSVVRGNVYNLTSWIGQHPGGVSAIKAMCGVDATADFDGQHGGQGRPESELSSFKIGVIK